MADSDVDRLLRLALLAPTESMAQAWSFVVVRDPERRGEIAELVIRGGGEYFRVMRAPAEGVGEDAHREWAREYATQVVGGLRAAPVWIVPLLVPRASVPEPHRRALAERERTAQLMSLAFAIENLFVAARAVGLGTLPTNFHTFLEDEFRALIEIPDDLEAPIITPLGYPVDFPETLPPALARLRRPWRSLVHEEAWGRPRLAAADDPQ